MELYVGPGREWDIDSWMELVEQVKDDFPGLETREAMEAHRKTVLDFMAKGEAICARDGASIVGVLLCSKEENRLCFLAVGEAYRRQHVAQRMVDYMKTILDAQRDIVVTTYRDGVPEGMAARAFYQRMGFVEGALTEEFHSPVQEFVYREPYPIHRLGDAEQVSDGLRYTPMRFEERLRLVRPVERYAEQVMAYREAMLKRGDELDGCAGLEEAKSFEEWMDFEGRQRAKYGDNYVSSEVFLAIRSSDDTLVGMIAYRHPLSPFLLQYGGNIGYSVLPSERGKGYASEMLKRMLAICREYGEERVLISCDKKNLGSARTIQKNGGVLENEVPDTVGLCSGGTIQRYWIALSETGGGR